MLVVFLMKRFLGVMAVALVSALDFMIQAQVPEIYDVFPKTAGAGEVLRIFGQNFDPVATNNIVHVAGARAQVLRSWVSEIEVLLPPSVQAGYITVSVSNKLAMSEIPFQPRFAPFGTNNPVYAQRLSFPGARHPAAVDLDNDGRLELVLSRQPNLIEVYKHTGSGPLLTSNSFTLVASLTGFTNTSSIRAMDLNSDGRYDLLVSTTNSGGWVIANAHRDGEINPAFYRAMSAPAAPSSVAFDVDRDGTLDLISWDGSRVRANRGVPQFGGGHQAYYGPNDISGPNVTSMAIADLNRDAHVDVVTLNGQQLTIHSHDGRMGIFRTYLQFTIPAQNLTALQIADIEGDGWPDILAYNRSTLGNEVFWNRNIGGHLSAGDFTRIVLTPQENSTLITPRLLDLDGDSFPDLITRSFLYHRNESSILGDIIFSGTFGPTNHYNVFSSSPLGIVSADLNADGLPDIITQEGVVYQNITAVAPLITSAYLGVDGAFYITLHGRANEGISIQQSNDLRNWTTLRQEKLGPNGAFTYWTGHPLQPARFFQLTPR